MTLNEAATRLAISLKDYPWYVGTGLDGTRIVVYTSVSPNEIEFDALDDGWFDFQVDFMEVTKPKTVVTIVFGEQAMAVYVGGELKAHGKHVGLQEFCKVLGYEVATMEVPRTDFPVNLGGLLP